MLQQGVEGVLNGAECICSLVHILILTFRFLKKSDLFLRITNILSIVLLFSQLVWIRFGAEWISGVQSHVQFDNGADENDCHPIVYAIASEMTTALYTIIGVTLCTAFTALIFNQN